MEMKQRYQRRASALMGLARMLDQWAGDRAMPEITAKSRNRDEPKVIIFGS